MDAEQMDLLERLARLRDLGAISRREFRREKEAIFRAPPRPVPVPLRALPAPGPAGTVAAVAQLVGPAAPAARARPPAGRRDPEATLFERVGRVAGWLLWTLFSIGGLDALRDEDPLLALSLLVAGLLFAPPLHRLLATRMALPTRVAITLLGVIAALGIGSANSSGGVKRAAAVSPQAAACGEAVSKVVEARGARAREGIARPWRKVWSDLVWARVAGRSAWEEWRATRAASG
jgi:hypothetical protein